MSTNNLDSLFVYVEDQYIQQFKSTYIDYDVETADLDLITKYDNNVVFLGSTGEVFTRGHIYGSSEVFVGDPKNAPATAKLIVDTTLEAAEVYTKSEVDERIKEISNKVDSLQVNSDLTIDDIANKFGAAHYVVENTTMYFFKNTNDKAEWIAAGMPKNSLLIMDSTVFEFSTKQYLINLTNNNISNILFFTNDSSEAIISLKPSTKAKTISDNDWSDFAEDYTISVQYDKHSQGNWEEIVINQNLIANESYTLDIIDLIDTTASRFRITILGTISGVITSFVYTATLTSMYLQSSNFDWQTPYIEGAKYLVGGLMIGGSISKTLYVKISNGESYSLTYSVNIGTNTYTANAYFFEGLEFPTPGTGVYNLDIWLDGGTVQSEHLYYNIICVKKEDEFTAQLVAVSNVSKLVINYYDNTLFDYVIYNRGISVGNLTVKVYQISHNIPVLITEETLSDVKTSVRNSYLKNVEIESEEAEMELYVQAIYGNEQKMNLKIDNSYNFPPTPGAVFYMNPSARSNTQENRDKFVNVVNDAEIPCTFNRLTWADGADGWTIDETGRKCLRLPSTTSVDVQYAPLNSVGNGKTIEFTFKVDNVSDYNKPIIYCCDNINNKQFRGFIIYPTQIVIHSKERNTPSQDSVQSYKFMEEETVNMQISIIKNYKTSYGNICIIFVNGVKKCEFSFSNYDDWEITNNIHFGSDYSDLYVYNMRVYNIAFGASNAITNYINSLLTLNERINCSESNKSIVNDEWQIDFDKVKDVANYGIVEVLDNGVLPGYGLTKSYTTWCNWEQHYHDHPEWDFRINEVQLSGQGTTSMNYKWWNLRVRTDKTSTKHTPSIEYLNNEVATRESEGSSYVKLDGGEHPAVQRITAKKNFASSMQSHKMGANLAFNDLHNEVVGENEVGGRVGLYQYPFYMFQKILVEGTNSYIYKFIGLYTIGPDKGDKATYGYKDSDVKDDLLVLEGVDHDKQLCIFKYPWTDTNVTYTSEIESISIDKGNDTYEKGWEVSNAGSAETDSQILDKCKTLWRPAYKVAYDNNPFLIYIDLDSEDISALNNAEWRTRFTPEGHSYQRYEIWLSSNYNLYYYDVAELTYKPSGVNVLTDLGLTESDVVGMTLDEKNQLFISRRKERFADNWTTYFDKDDTLFHFVWCYIFGATDNLAKNTYPYILGTYENGYKWRWRQDDLDTIFDIDNQGHSVKGYSIEPDDWTDDSQSAYVYKGEDSAFWTLIRDTQQVDIKLMGKRILKGMYDLSDEGASTIDRLFGFFKKYFWCNAQEYFTKSAYNADAELIYEDSWPLYENGQYSVDVNPLEQSLGDHYEAERAWVYKRLIYCMSKFQYSVFSAYEDTCLGRITVRTQYQQGFTLTPAIDMYPVIISGQGTILGATERIKAGEPISFSGAGGTNTNIYIMAADYIKSLGDLKDLVVDATTSASLTLGAKRLESIKLGDEDPSKVTGNLQQLSVGDCPSIITIDCRNLESLTGSLDLSKAPSLKYLYLGNTDIRTVIIANGARITTIELPDSIQTINFNNLKYLEEGNKEANTGLLYNEDAVKNIQYLRIENCTAMDAYDLFKSCYLANDQLKLIRVVNFTHDGTLEDFDILSNITKNISSKGTYVEYRGIDANGNIVNTMNPIIEGTLNIDGAAYKDSVEDIRNFFYNMTLNINGGYYIRFADDYIKTILLEHGMGDTENGLPTDIHENKLKTITDQLIYDWFSITKASDTSSSSRDLIYLAQLNAMSFTELENMTGITELKASGSGNTAFGIFTGYKDLEEVSLPINTKIIGYNTFRDCTNLKRVHLGQYVTNIRNHSFRNCTSLEEFEITKNLISIESDAFYGDSNIKKLILSISDEAYATNLNIGGNNSCIPYLSRNIDEFAIYSDDNTQKTNFVFPETLNTVRDRSFMYWKDITFENVLNNNVIQKIGANSFEYCTGLVGDLNMPIVSQIGTAAFRNTGITSIKMDAIANLPANCFENCYDLTNVNMKNLTLITTGSVFKNCTSLKNFNFENVTELSGANIFEGTALEEVIIPKFMTGLVLGDNVFLNCKSLRKVVIAEGRNIDIQLFNSIFSGCSTLEEVLLPMGTRLTMDKYHQFRDCVSLKEINLPVRTATSREVFYGCNNLSITRWTNPGMDDMRTNIFNNLSHAGHTIDMHLVDTCPLTYNGGWISQSVHRIVVSDKRYNEIMNMPETFDGSYTNNMWLSTRWRLVPYSDYLKQPILNYIMFNGSQQYDSGIYGTGYLKFDIYMQYPTATPGNETYIFGARTRSDKSDNYQHDTPDAYGLCYTTNSSAINGKTYGSGWMVRCGKAYTGNYTGINENWKSNQKIWYYAPTTSANTNTLVYKQTLATTHTVLTGSNSVDTPTDQSVANRSRRYAWRLRGGVHDGFEFGYNMNPNNMGKAQIIHPYAEFEINKNLNIWLGALNNNNTIAGSALSGNAKVYWMKFYYTYYYIHTLYATEAEAIAASAGKENVEIHESETGKFYYTNYDLTSDNDYRIYDYKYVERADAEAAATGDYIITSHDEEVADFRPYKYTDEDGQYHVTFKDIVRDYVCPNYGFDGQYGEY